MHTALLTLTVHFMHTISLSNAGPVVCHVMYTVASIMSVFIFLTYWVLMLAVVSFEYYSFEHGSFILLLSMLQPLRKGCSWTIVHIASCSDESK